MNRLDKIKNHLKNNKHTYIVGAGTFVLGIVTTMWLVQRGNLYLIKADEGVGILNNGNDNTFITNYINHRGRPGNPVRCDQTLDVFKSQELAAIANAVSESSLSQHLNGRKEAIKGLTFTRLIPEV